LCRRRRAANWNSEFLNVFSIFFRKTLCLCVVCVPLITSELFDFNGSSYQWLATWSHSVLYCYQRDNTTKFRGGKDTGAT
jgi:hypothetical protein